MSRKYLLVLSLMTVFALPAHAVLITITASPSTDPNALALGEISDVHFPVTGDSNPNNDGSFGSHVTNDYNLTPGGGFQSTHNIYAGLLGLESDLSFMTGLGPEWICFFFGPLIPPTPGDMFDGPSPGELFSVVVDVPGVTDTAGLTDAEILNLAGINPDDVVFSYAGGALFSAGNFNVILGNAIAGGPDAKFIPARVIDLPDHNKMFLAVPEPASAMLMGLGLLGFICGKHNRNRVLL